MTFFFYLPPSLHLSSFLLYMYIPYIVVLHIQTGRVSIVSSSCPPLPSPTNVASSPIFFSPPRLSTLLSNLSISLLLLPISSDTNLSLRPQSCGTQLPDKSNLYAYKYTKAHTHTHTYTCDCPLLPLWTIIRRVSAAGLAVSSLKDSRHQSGLQGPDNVFVLCVNVSQCFKHLATNSDFKASWLWERPVQLTLCFFNWLCCAVSQTDKLTCCIWVNVNRNTKVY